MTGPVVEVEGARQLRRSLKAAGDDLTDLTSTHAAISRLVVTSTHPPRRTGRLAGSVRGSGTKTAAVVRAGGARIPYAAVVEYGSPTRHIRPRPYLTAAAHATEPRWRAMYLDTVNRRLGKVKGV